MPPLPVLKERELICILAKLGFYELRHSGIAHPDGRCTTVSIHGGGRDIPNGTLRATLKDISISAAELKHFLNG